MRIVALQKPQDHDTTLKGAAALCSALLLTALTAVPSHSATAQGAVPCTAIEDDAERLACYDRALRAAPPPATQAPSRSSPPTTAAPSPAASPSAAQARSERRVRESAAPTAPAAPAAPVAGGDDDGQIIPIVVVSLRALPGRETTFTTNDGTSWVQTDSQRLVGLPETPFEAEIKPGAIGSYFLVAEGRARAIRVRPLR
jgi:hypothetical protein